MDLFPYPPASEITDLLLLEQRESSALGIALTVMLVGAARNPQSNALVIRATMIGVALAGVVELTGIWGWGPAGCRLYPVTITVVHALTRFPVVGLLMYLTVRGQRAGTSTLATYQTDSSTTPSNTKRKAPLFYADRISAPHRVGDPLAGA